jgi:hypothetical protein
MRAAILVSAAASAAAFAPGLAPTPAHRRHGLTHGSSAVAMQVRSSSRCWIRCPWEGMRVFRSCIVQARVQIR